MTRADTVPGCDTHAMVVVHRVFTREFRLLAATATATPPGDREQIERVVRHGREMLVALHHHHESEDELVWPRLRSVGVEAELIDAMQAQHGRLATTMNGLDAALTAWELDGSTATQVAAAARRLHAVLAEHLDQEERIVLPIVARTLTRSQWAELGERGIAALPKRRTLVFLGHILEDADEAERKDFLREIPPPVRVLYRLIGRPGHARETRRLRRDLDRTTIEG